MKWIDQFQLFLFDFDGVLVDTEPLHYAAYADMCLRRGIPWKWNFEQFCVHAHGEAQGIKKALYKEFPELLAQEPNWDVLAGEKKKIYTALLQSRPLVLMPGVERLLQELQNQKRMHCVVTNSSREHVEIIRNSLPILQKIPHWLTRDDYILPKPSPEGYMKAITLYGSDNGLSIGFEDTFKGFKALSQTPAHPVLICPAYREHVADCLALGGQHFESFEAIDRVGN
jgi:beta-phosphoglucomutase